MRPKILEFLQQDSARAIEFDQTQRDLAQLTQFIDQTERRIAPRGSAAP